MTSFKEIVSQFDEACQYFQQVAQINQIEDPTLTMAQKEAIVQKVEYEMIAENSDFQNILSTATGQRINAELKTQINNLLSQFTITTPNPYPNNGAGPTIPVYAATTTWVSTGPDGDGYYKITYGAPLTLANFDPNESIAFNMYPPEDSDGDLEINTNFAPWMPPYAGEGMHNGAEAESGQDIYNGTPYTHSWDPLYQGNGVTISYSNQNCPPGVHSVGTTTVSTTPAAFMNNLTLNDPGQGAFASLDAIIG